ncbi:MAG: hypothetical protein AAGB16_09750 [Pseudomonadota bacterium]
MIKTLTSFALAASIFGLSAPMATALTSAQIKQCNAMGKSLKARQAEAAKKAEARKVLHDKVEAAGDAWDDVEIHRLASAGHAKTADEAKAKYEALKADLIKQNMAVQSLVNQINEDVAAYNGLCVKD